MNQFELTATFRAALARFSRRVEETCKTHGLTTDQYTLLVMIKGAPGGVEHATATELAESLRLSLNGITERLQRAEAEGFVRRERSTADRRVIYVRLTQLAEERLAGAFNDLRMDAELVATLRDVFDAFEAEQRGVTSSDRRSPKRGLSATVPRATTRADAGASRSK